MRQQTAVNATRGQYGIAAGGLTLWLGSAHAGQPRQPTQRARPAGRSKKHPGARTVQPSAQPDPGLVQRRSQHQPDASAIAEGGNRAGAGQFEVTQYGGGRGPGHHLTTSRAMKTGAQRTVQERLPGWVMRRYRVRTPRCDAPGRHRCAAPGLHPTAGTELVRPVVRRRLA